MRRIALTLLLLCPALASAHEYVCTNAGVTRMISVQHEVTGQEVPCVVRYDKPDEGGTEFPWSAQNTLGYCAEKAEYLAGRLSSFGWDCNRTDNESSEGHDHNH